MKIRWEIRGENGNWFARASNKFTFAIAKADNLFSAMEKAEEELVRKTENILRKMMVSGALITEGGDR